MKKNKRLLYTFGYIDNKYIDEAMSDKARKARPQWKYIITAAACFVIIASVPVYMMKKSLNRNGSNGNGDITVTEASEVTSESQTHVTTEQTKQTEPTPEKNVLIAGTGPEKPADYKPDGLLSYGGYYDFKDGYFVVSFLKDKEFEDRINSDIREATDSLKPYFDEKYLENTMNFQENDPYSWKNLNTTNGLTIHPLCINGYLSILMGYTSQINSSYEGTFMNQNFEHAVTLTYDLFEQKKIDKFSDLFYYGEDILSLVNKVMEDDIKSAGSLLTAVQKKKFDGLTQLPELFTFNTFILNPDNQFFNAALQIECSPYFDNRIYDHMIVGKYRDMKGIESQILNSTSDCPQTPEWTYNNTDYCEQEDNFTVHYTRITGSRYHTDDEINEYMNTYYEIQHTAFEYFKKNCNPEDFPELFVKSKNGYDVFINNLWIIKSPYLNNTYSVFNKNTLSDNIEPTINIDTNTNRVLTFSEIFGADWKENIVIQNDMDNDILKNTNIDHQIWYIEDVFDGSARVIIGEGEGKGNRAIPLNIPVDKIKPDYFNSDFEEDLHSPF